MTETYEQKRDRLLARLDELNRLPREKEIVEEEIAIETELGRMFRALELDEIWPESGVPI